MAGTTKVGELEMGYAAPSGALYVLRSRIRGPYGDDHDLLHVMSRPAGGEIRGYVSVNGGPWQVRLPNYTGDWPEVDRAVEKLCDIKVAAQAEVAS